MSCRLRDELRPGAALHLTESGILCNAPRGCSGNDYACYYKTHDFDRGASRQHHTLFGCIRIQFM